MTLGRSRRNFSILDAMTFVAASAVGLTLIRWARPKVGYWPVTGSPIPYWIWWGPPSCAAYACALALIAARLSHPRPRWRQLARQPGFVASVMTVGAWPVGYFTAWVRVAVERNPPGYTNLYSPESFWMSGAELIPEAVAGAWFALALGGRWKPEPSWIDRAGRILGIFWVAYYPILIIQPFLKYAFPSRF